MARWVAPDKGVKETVIGNSTYRPDRGGVYNVDNPAHARAMKAEGYFEAALNPYDKRDGERGFTCVECGFGSWFALCSRCGHNNSSDTPTDGNS
jgi:hypothetical protein